MELYTSLVRLKQALRGELPPMTPLPEAVKKIIDPSLTINGDGWGGVVEDPAKGLLCPIRGCGRYWQNLGSHLTNSHKDIGGDKGFRELMSIPTTAPMITRGD